MFCGKHKNILQSKCKLTYKNRLYKIIHYHNNNLHNSSLISAMFKKKMKYLETIYMEFGNKYYKWMFLYFQRRLSREILIES